VGMFFPNPGLFARCLVTSKAAAGSCASRVVSSFDVSAGFTGATRAPENISARRLTTNSTLLSDSNAIVWPRFNPILDICAIADRTRVSSCP
jgi:hypothetical protein